MGGTLQLRVCWPIDAEAPVDAVALTQTRAYLVALAQRVRRWAAIATRHDASQLTRLNGATAAEAPVGPTLASLLAWSADAWEATGGLVDITLLDARLAAELGVAARRPTTRERTWSLTASTRTIAGRTVLVGGTVRREAGVRFDLGGVGKGWIADRAAALLATLLDRAVSRGELPAWSSCFVDADGDIAIVNRDGATTDVQVATAGDPLGVVHVVGATAGVATSGTGVHRWDERHHLIDPRTGAPSKSGIAQATVVASSARVAEAWAKSIVIEGTAAIARAERDGASLIIAVRENGQIVTAPAVEPLHVASHFTPGLSVANPLEVRAEVGR